MKKKRKKHKIRKKRRVSRKTGKKKAFNIDKFQPLIEKGKERGFVTYSEILYAFPDVEKDIKGLEKLYDVLEKQSVEIKEAK